MTARAVQLVLNWGESGVAVADGLSNLLKVNLLSGIGMKKIFKILIFRYLPIFEIYIITLETQRIAECREQTSVRMVLNQS